MELTQTFSDAKVLIVGDIMLDRYWWGDVTRISPEAPVPVVRLRAENCAPGGAANVAANIVGLGAKHRLVGCIGADESGKALRRALAERGVSDEHLCERGDTPTIVKTRVIAHSQQVVRVDHEEVVPVASHLEARIFEAVLASLPWSDVVVVSDYGKGTLTENVLSSLISEARAARKPVVVDPKGKDFTKYRGASVLTPNRREAAEATHEDESDSSFLSRSAERLIADLGLDAVLITRSDDGMSLFRRDQPEVWLRSQAQQVYDVTGAGDTVIATFAAALASEYDYALAASLSNAAAGIVVQQVGTTVITAEQLRASLVSLSDSAPAAARLNQ